MDWNTRIGTRFVDARAEGNMRKQLPRGVAGPGTVSTADDRGTLLWQLKNPTHQKIDCVAVVRPDGQVQVLIERERDREQRGVFTDASAAVAWALDFERSLLSEGWAKVV